MTGWQEEQSDEQSANLRRKGSKGDAEGWTPIKRTKGHISFVRESYYRAWEQSLALLGSKQNSKLLVFRNLTDVDTSNRLIGDPLL